MELLKSQVAAPNIVTKIAPSNATSPSYEALLSIVEPVTGIDRYNTIKLLAKKVPDSLTYQQVAILIGSSSYPDKAREVLRVPTQ